MLLFFILEYPAITLEIVIVSKTKEKENIVNGVLASFTKNYINI